MNSKFIKGVASSIAVTVILLPTLSTQAATNDKVTKKVVKLKATNDAVGLEDVELIIEGNKKTVKFKKFKAPNTVAHSYKIDVQEATGTFKTEKVFQPISKQTAVVSPKTALSGNGYGYSAEINILTEDPPNLDLAKTYAWISWSKSSTGTIVAGNKKLTTWSANPSPLGTHWYTYAAYFNPTSYDDLNRTMRQSFNVSYYNYDFGSKDKATWVYHNASIEAYANGGFYYYIEYSHTGDFSYFLDTTVSVI
jgi:hypothetical protein